MNSNIGKNPQGIEILSSGFKSLHKTLKTLEIHLQDNNIGYKDNETKNLEYLFQGLKPLLLFLENIKLYL